MSTFDVPVPDPIDPVDALADLETAYEQGEPGDLLVIEEPPPPIGRSWAFDFTRMRFVARGHGPVETRGDATLIVWMEKCLRTARGAHPIHPPGYGLVRPTQLIGVGMQGAPVAELEARIRDALTFHPRVSTIEDFAWEEGPDEEVVSISFTVIRDDDTTLNINAVLPLTPTGAGG